MGHGPKPNVASLSAASEVWIGLPFASKGVTVTTVHRSSTLKVHLHLRQ